MLDSRLVVVVGAVALLLGAAGSVVAAPAAPDASGTASHGLAASDADAVTTIDSCTAITEPGIYVLSANLTNATATEGTGLEVATASNATNVTACVLVASSDVVLDGAGHVVDGPDVANASAEGALDGESEAAGASVGVAVHDPDGGALENVSVLDVATTDWDVGTYVGAASNATLGGVRADGNADVGVQFDGTTDGVVVASAADDNGFAGLYATGTRNLTVLSSSFDGNGVFGVELAAGNERPVVVNATVSNASVAGIAVVQSSDAIVAESTVVDAGGADDRLGYSASYLFADAPNAVVLDSASVRDGSWAAYATTCENAGGVCTPDVPAPGDRTLTVSGLAVGGANVSLTGENVAVGSVDALGDDGASEGMTIGDGVVVTNTAPDAVLDLSTAWGDGEPVAVSSTRFAVGNRTGGTGTDAASIETAGRRVVVTGTIWGSDACYTAELLATTYDPARDVLTVVVTATKDVDADTACAQVLTEIPYRAVVTLTGPPGGVEVVHVRGGESVTVATAGDVTPVDGNVTVGNATAGNATDGNATAGNATAAGGR